MTCRLKHSRALNDILSLFAVQLTRDGTAADLNGRVVKFVMYDGDGNVVVTEDDAHVNISDPDNGYVEYDFQAADVDVAGTFYGYFKVYNGAETEGDTYPPKDGIEITIYNPATAQTTTTPSIDFIESANAPLRTRTVEGMVQERSIDELIAADRYQASKNASEAVPWGMRIAKTKPPSTLS